MAEPRNTRADEQFASRIREHEELVSRAHALGDPARLWVAKERLRCMKMMRECIASGAPEVPVDQRSYWFWQSRQTALEDVSKEALS